MTSSSALKPSATSAYKNTHEAEFATAAKAFVENQKVPASLECALTMELMHDPVMTCEGNTYERSAITEWLKSHDTDPCIGTVLRELNLTPNRTVKSQIEAFRAAVRALGPEAAKLLPEPPAPTPSPAEKPQDAFSKVPSRQPQASASDALQVPGYCTAADPPLKKPVWKPEKLSDSQQRSTVAYQRVFGTSLNTFRKAKSAALRGPNTIEAYQSVIGGYLEAKRLNELPRLNYTTNREEYRYSRTDIRYFNHLMHKLETLSASVANTKARRQVWSQAVNPFRRQLYNELYKSNELVRAFAGSLPGGRMSLPEMDDWTLGIKRRNRFSMPFDLRKFRPANAKAPMDLLGVVHTALLVDDSGSMNGQNWNEVTRLLGDIAPLLSRYADPDFANYKDMDMECYKREKLKTVHSQGFDLHFLHHPNPVQGLRTAPEVFQIFNRVRPAGGTPTGQRINDLLDAYMSTLRFDRDLKPLNLAVITDGASADYPEDLLDLAIEEHVSHVVQRGHPAHQLGVEFLQVGNDWAAADHLDELEETVDRHHRNLNCDIVGVTHMNTLTEGLTPDVLAKIMVQGIEARESGYHRDFRVRRQQARQMRVSRSYGFSNYNDGYNYGNSGYGSNAYGSGGW